MASAAEQTDHAQCLYYAEFARHLDRWQFDFLYWILFGCNILLLSFVSWWYGRTHEKVKDLPGTNPEFVRVHKRCLVVSVGCFVVSIVMVVMEVFALLALQFCDGEDLMSLYWSTWAMLQFGSCIAISGIVLHVALVLQGHERPPWALALGTPVLVVAGIGNLVNTVLHRKTARVIDKTIARSRRGRSGSGSFGWGESRSRSISRSGTPPMSQAPTIRPDSRDSSSITTDTPTYDAKVVGTALDGGVIVQFSQAVPELESRGRLLCRATDGQVLVSFGRENVSILPLDQSSAEPAVLDGASAMRRPPPVRRASHQHQHHRLYRGHKSTASSSSPLSPSSSSPSPYDLPGLPAIGPLKLDLPLPSPGEGDNNGEDGQATSPASPSPARPGTLNGSVYGEKPSQISILEPPTPPRR